MEVLISSSEQTERIFYYRLSNKMLNNFVLPPYALCVPVVFPDEYAYQSFLESAKDFIVSGKITIGKTKTKDLEKKLDENVKNSSELVNGKLNKDLGQIVKTTEQFGIGNITVETKEDKSSQIIQTTKADTFAKKRGRGRR